jgi:AcrR family transcriptional regulator
MAMPKMVDHAERRREIAESVWRVVRHDGLAAATVRAVAAEAGWSPGALRHYFGTQDELLTFTMQLVADRARARIAELPHTTDPRRWAERALSELLPLDDERRAENDVWIAFHTHVLVDPAIGAVRDETYDAIRALCRRVVATLASGGGPLPAARADLLARELNVLLDGLALHAALRPDQWPPRQLRRVLRHHLNALQESLRRRER